MEELEKVDSEKWVTQLLLLHITLKIKKLEYDLRVERATKEKFLAIAKDYIKTCSHCGCSNLGVYKSESKDGAVFYCCNEHVPFQKKENGE